MPDPTREGTYINSSALATPARKEIEAWLYGS